MGWGSIADFANNLLNKIIPDPTQKAAAALQLAQLQQQGEFKEIDAQLAMMKAQTDVNLAEASNNSLFVSGWRPFIGWVGGAALVYQYLLRPLLPFVFNVLGHPIPDPMSLDSSLQELVYAMLGVAGMRSFDKAVPHVTGAFSNANK
jgi:hypothetical protein